MRFHHLFRFFVIPIALLLAVCSSCQSAGGLPSEGCRQVHTRPEAFGAQDWKRYFGVDIGKEPPMPANIEEILDGEAPFLLDGEESRQRIRDNHLLTLIPAKVNGQAFTLDRLGELALRYFPENNKGDTGNDAHGYRYYSEYLTDQNRKEPLSGEAYWLLLPKTILAGSRGRVFSDQEAMVASYSGSGYQLPRALEVASSLLSHYARSQERLYVDEPWTCTRCSDRDEDGNPMIVGGFSAAGFFTSISDDEDFSPSGVSCCWKFLTPGTWYSNP